MNYSRLSRRFVIPLFVTIKTSSWSRCDAFPSAITYLEYDLLGCGAVLISEVHRRFGGTNRLRLYDRLPLNFSLLGLLFDP